MQTIIQAREIEAYYASLIESGLSPDSIETAPEPEPEPEPRDIVRDLEAFGQFIDDYFAEFGGVSID